MAIKDQSHEKTLRTWKAWAKEGTEITSLSGELAVTDRETSMSFIGREQTAEITTASYSWQKRIESLGCVPSHITRFDGATEIRYYPKVSKAFIRMPSKGRKG